jgi:hypothetical protein
LTAVSAATPAREPLDRTLLSIAAVIVLGAIMSILDTTVVNVAINTLARDFDTSLATIQWIATGYTLALATVIRSRAGRRTASARSGSTCSRSRSSWPARRCPAPPGPPAR